MQKVVLWDFDGVLADTLEECYEVTKRVVEKEKKKLMQAVHGKPSEGKAEQPLAPYPFQEFANDRAFCVNAADFFASYLARRKYGGTTEKNMQKNMQEIHEQQRPLIVELDEAYYEERAKLAGEMGEKYFEWLKPYPEIFQTVKRLHFRGVRQGVMTARDSQSVKEWLHYYGVGKEVEEVVGTEISRADRMVKKKQILLLKEKLGEGQYFFVDDIAHNLEAVHAVDSSIRLVFALWGYGKEAPASAAIVKTPAALQALI